MGEFSTSIRKSIKYKSMIQPLQTLYLIGFKCYLIGNQLWYNTSVLFKVKQHVLKKIFFQFTSTYVAGGLNFRVVK